MPNKVDVYYDGWQEHWHWGTLVSTTVETGRPIVMFEYSDEAKRRGLELSAYLLPLSGPQFHKDFPGHQMGLPGPVYDSLPDGWGLLLMDRLFKCRHINPSHIGPLDRLTYIADNAMGAMSFEPVSDDLSVAVNDISIEQLASEVTQVLKGEGGEFLQQLIVMGGSPQGARPKALLYRQPDSDVFCTAAQPDAEAWLVKFPAQYEHPEVCAIEFVYAECLRRCDIEMPETHYFSLPDGRAAFAVKRFDRQNGIKIPMQSLASFTGADYKVPGSLDYVNFLRATQYCTNDVREKKIAFKRAVFNVAFNNRDDHPKNFSYLMSSTGEWKLAPAYDVTFCGGPGGYHQMDVNGEAWRINRQCMMQLGVKEAEFSVRETEEIIDQICDVALKFKAISAELFRTEITQETMDLICMQIGQNVSALQSA